MPGRPKTKTAKDYRILVMTSTGTKVICTLCGNKIEKGQAYYYKLGDEMHTMCQ